MKHELLKPSIFRCIYLQDWERSGNLENMLRSKLVDRLNLICQKRGLSQLWPSPCYPEFKLVNHFPATRNDALSPNYCKWRTGSSRSLIFTLRVAAVNSTKLVTSSQRLMPETIILTDFGKYNKGRNRRNIRKVDAWRPDKKNKIEHCKINTEIMSENWTMG